MSGAPPTSIRLLTSVAVVVLLAAGLVTVALRTSTVSSSGSSGSSPQNAQPPDTPPDVAAPTSAPSVATIDELPVITQIREQVSALRGLAWKTPLPIKVVSPEELSRLVREVNARDLDPAQLVAEGETYKLLHVIPRDLDYAATLNDLYASQVLGFYDPETKEMFVRDPGGDSLEPTTKITIAHELDHALTDQHFDFGSKIEALEDQGRDEEVSAMIALVEGDARYTDHAWTDKHLSEDEALAAIFGGDTDVSSLAEIPPFMLESLTAPYSYGIEFAGELVESGGLGRLNTAYERPPTSTEQVLHPELYLADQGWTPPALPDVAAATGCEAVHRGTLGELEMALVLDAGGVSGDDADDATRGWNGDSFQVVRCGGALGMVDRWRGDDAGDASRLAAALADWSADWSGSGRQPGAAGTFAGDEGAGRVVQRGDQVDLVLADDRATADRLAAAVGAP